MIIISDSSCDIWTLEDTHFNTVPLEIYTDEKRFVDDNTLDTHEMLNYLEAYKGRSYTSCPGTETWIEAFNNSDEIYIVTMTSGLSGTYNSAECAKNTYLETHPDAKIHVFDTLSTSSEQLLVIEKIKNLKKSGLSFDQVVSSVNSYMKTTRLFFAFESLHNFAQNGRVPKILAQAINFLGISIIGTASEEGKVKPISKCRGKKKVISGLLNQLLEAGYSGGKVNICHVENESLAGSFAKAITDLFPKSEVKVYPSRGLCAYYGERGGLIVGCECV